MNDSNSDVLAGLILRLIASVIYVFVCSAIGVVIFYAFMIYTKSLLITLVVEIVFIFLARKWRLSHA